ncbi:hypothetical protein PSMA108079_11530 [Pseudoalteromonas mariniglutinosa]
MVFAKNFVPVLFYSKLEVVAVAVLRGSATLVKQSLGALYF